MPPFIRRDQPARRRGPGHRPTARFGAAPTQVGRRTCIVIIEAGLTANPLTTWASSPIRSARCLRFRPEIELPLAFGARVIRTDPHARMGKAGGSW